ncbi:MAG TPA: response regulator transcription factor [Verrucomicrobiae bacterium]|nr:response regulator transcription factor [Verrucomicrobiae bacterium]
MGQEKLLIVEDEADLSRLLSSSFTREGFLVETAADGEEGVEKTFRFSPDLILLDLLLPKLDGFSVCRYLKSREETKAIPILMLTAKGTEEDKLKGLELGADDYVTKPFSIRELSARVRSIFRRRYQSDAGKLKAADLEIDSRQLSVARGGKSLFLTPIQFRLLYVLASQKGRVMSRSELLDRVWGFDAVLTDRVVDAQIKRLRQTLRRVLGEDRYIKTVRGAGYRFTAPPEKGENGSLS